MRSQVEARLGMPTGCIKDHKVWLDVFNGTLKAYLRSRLSTDSTSVRKVLLFADV